MRVLCAWCLKEGKPEAEALIGEREPLADPHDSQAVSGPKSRSLISVRPMTGCLLRRGSLPMTFDADLQQFVSDRVFEVPLQEAEDEAEVGLVGL